MGPTGGGGSPVVVATLATTTITPSTVRQTATPGRVAVGNGGNIATAYARFFWASQRPAAIPAIAPATLAMPDQPGTSGAPSPTTPEGE